MGQKKGNISLALQIRQRAEEGAAHTIRCVTSAAARPPSFCKASYLMIIVILIAMMNHCPHCSVRDYDPIARRPSRDRVRFGDSLAKHSQKTSSQRLGRNKEKK